MKYLLTVVRNSHEDYILFISHNCNVDFR